MAQTATFSTFAPRRVSFAAVAAWIVTRFDVMNQRRKLRTLDDAALADIGLTFKDALHQSRKPFFL